MYLNRVGTLCSIVDSLFYLQEVLHYLTKSYTPLFTPSELENIPHMENEVALTSNNYLLFF